MLNWLRDNAGTIAVLLVLLAVLAAIIRYLWKEKRSGRGCCGGNCQACAMCARGDCSGKSRGKSD